MPSPQKNDTSIPKEILIAASAAEQVKQRNAAAAQSEEAEFETQAQTVAALGALSASGGTSTPSDLQAQVMQALLANLQHDMAKKRKKEEEEEENLRRLMLARADSIKHEKAQRENTQRVCDHRKENGHSRICGQRLSNNSIFFMCNLCYKEFDQNTLPPHLQISSELVGG